MNPPHTSQPDPYTQTVFHQVRLFPEDCDARRLAARLMQLRQLAQRDKDASSGGDNLCRLNRIETELSDPACRARHLVSAHATYRPSFAKLRQALETLAASPEQRLQLQQADPHFAQRFHTRLAELRNQLPGLSTIDPGLAALLARLLQASADPH